MLFTLKNPGHSHTCRPYNVKPIAPQCWCKDTNNFRDRSKQGRDFYTLLIVATKINGSSGKTQESVAALQRCSSKTRNEKVKTESYIYIYINIEVFWVC